MSLRRKTVLITVLATLVATAAVGVTLHWIAARGLARMERHAALAAVERVHLSLDDAREALAANADDWGVWDDTWRFLQDRNADYVKANLTDNTLSTLHLDLLLMLDRRGEVLTSMSSGAGRAPVAARDVSLLRPLLAPALRDEGKSGLLTLSSGIFLIAARGVVKSDKSGPSAGLLIMGKRLTPTTLKDMGEETGTSISLWPSHEGRGTRSEVTLRFLSESRLRASAMLADLNGQRSIAVQVEVPRELHRQSTALLRSAWVGLLVCMALFGAAINWLLRRVVTARLGRLTEGIGDIAARHDASARVTVEGQDELAGLAAGLNQMLASLEQSQDQVREREAELRAVVDSVQTGILVVDAETHRVVSANAAALAITGHTHEQLVGQLCHHGVCPAEQGQCPITDLGQRLDQSERVVLTPEGARIPVMKRAVQITLGGRACILESFLDITDLKRAEEAIRHQAYHDSLTGLANRQSFREQLDAAIATAEECGTEAAVFMIDLDRFKTINDTLGHSAGDELLRAVSARLARCLRPADVVARLGGDEFAVVLPDLPEDRVAGAVAQRMLKALRDPVEVDGITLYITGSIGISSFPRDAGTAEELLRRADLALYHAKDQGRDAFRYYSSGLEAASRARLSLGNELWRALERDELELFYQVQVDAKTEAVVGVEALLRWRHPVRGLLLPLEFLPVAEENSVMVALGEWVVQRACQQAAAWREAGLPPVRIAVNLSPSQFRQQHLVDLVAQEMQRYEIEPGRLEVEVTETAVMPNPEVAGDLMGCLRAAGARICLDDFGVGNTSLAQLRRFPIDTLKIDKSFVRSVETNPTDAAIISAIIGIGESLDLLVVAEGVEKAAQADFLRARGCAAMQGYLFGRPLPAEEVTQVLARQGVGSRE